MNVKNFFLNFNLFKKPEITPEELHINFLIENRDFSKIYDLFQKQYKFSKTFEDTLIVNFFKSIKNNTFDEKYSKEFTYFFKILNLSDSLKSKYLEEQCKRYKELDFVDNIVVSNFYNQIMRKISLEKNNFNKNTTEFNTEFFKFFDSVLQEPNKIPEGFTFPKEFVFMFLLENDTKKLKDVTNIFKVANVHHSLFLDSTPINEDYNSIVNIKNIEKYFKELGYQIKQAEIQKLPSINITSDDMQSKIVKSIVKPQISEINQIQNFIDTTELTEDLKISLTMITATLNYLSNKELLPEELHNINTIKENLYQNLNDYDNVMEFLDKKDIDDYKSIYVNMATNLSQTLLNYEKNKLNNLEQVQKVTKFRYK